MSFPLLRAVTNAGAIFGRFAVDCVEGAEPPSGPIKADQDKTDLSPSGPDQKNTDQAGPNKELTNQPGPNLPGSNPPGPNQSVQGPSPPSDSSEPKAAPGGQTPGGGTPQVTSGTTQTSNRPKDDLSDFGITVISLPDDDDEEEAKGPSGTHEPTPSADKPLEISITSALLKDHNGVKITGPCSADFQLFLVPHIIIHVESAKDKIELRSKWEDVDNKQSKGAKVPVEELKSGILFKQPNETLENNCAEGKNFKFVLYVHEDQLIVKWKVYNKTPAATDNKKVDVRKYLVKNLKRPITTIHVHSSSVNQTTFLLESKSYALKKDIPDQCDAMVTNCFLSGILDVEKCYHCSLLVSSKDTSNMCFNYASPDIKEKFNEIKVEGQDDEESSEYKLAQAIDAVLSGIYKKDQNGKKELLTWGEVDSNVKEQISSYCHLLKDVDTSGTLDVHQMGSQEHIFNNLITLLQNHSEEKQESLQNKLKNAAICLKQAHNWVANKVGLALPQLAYNPGKGVEQVEENPPNGESANGESAHDHTHEQGFDGVIDLPPFGTSGAQASVYSDSMYCNGDYCDRAKDSSSCMAKIEAGDQGDCANSWLFASKAHLEAIKCMKGHDHVGASALYVANCSGKEAKDKCHVASNPLEFLNTLEETRFLPAESDLPYSYKAVNNVCPQPKSHWKNLWANVKLLEKQCEPNAVSTKGYTAYQSDHFKGNMDAFIKTVKSELMKKGSAIAYVKAAGALSYDLNGKKVLSLCGSETPDLAVNIVGYGNYISAEGQKKSYWLLQNSWGKHWGDKGTFKVDMLGPDHCHHNFIHTAAVFNLDMPQASPPPVEFQLSNYYLKSSPDFYTNLYYKNVNAPAGGAKVYGSEAELEATVEGAKNGVAQPAAGGGRDAAQEAAQPTEGGGNGQSEAAPEVAEPPAAPGPVDGEASSRTTVESPVTPQQAEEGTPSASLTTDQSSAQAQGPQSSGGAGQGVAPTQPVVPTPTPQHTSTAVLVKAPPAQSADAESKEVLHILKHVKDNKVKTNLVTYSTTKSITDDHSCSRSHAQDPEKQSECIDFCEKNWNACADKISPGYCLMQKRGKNDCIFCYV
ncbi:cysteine protease, putative [Plasmodium vivax]|uniref:Serine-repeat antigen 3 (SERA) n=1 Tax=Plasmodium vivax TaxID=5855 RepID=A0A1G4H897_PLAVI|nr:cysteine protease, putative [Plasmodium vivax]